MQNVVCWLIMTLIAPGSWAKTDTYDFPFDDPLVATVLGTPKSYRSPLDYDIPRKEKRIVVFPDRQVPYVVARSRYLYALTAQKGPAPLIFVIAGTGASHRGEKMRLLEAAFYEAGFHVVALSSPTYANFIITASSTHIPGRTTEDAADLYRVMEAIWNANKKRMQVTAFHLTGYSLGGTNAAFVAKLDEQRRVFDFKKVLMINPPVNLFNSVGILDAMLDQNIPGPAAPDFNAFFERVMDRFTKVYRANDELDFNDEFLYRIYEADREAGRRPRAEDLEALIGAAFRLSSANMITTADFAAQQGYIVPVNHRFRVSESTTPYFKMAARVSFRDYINDLYIPYFRAKDATATRTSLIAETGLEAIQEYLRNTEKIAVVHNIDDVILAPGEIDFFPHVFGDRAKLYPRGGHLGNIAHRDNLTFVVDYFKH